MTDKEKIEKIIKKFFLETQRLVNSLIEAIHEEEELYVPPD